jgi:ubiquinone/menaquinone biosynthesis C-methylase UbiE
MGAAVYRSEEAESREFMNQISATLESRAIRSSNHKVHSSGARDFVLVQEAYDRWAPTYDQFPNPLLSLEERELGSLIPQLRGKRLLDLACGTGRWLEKLSSQGADVAVGIDYSAAMLWVAEAKTAIRGKLVRADCQSLPFQPSTFDFVVCSFALGHIRDLRGLAQELGRVARTGADILTSDLHPEAYEKGWRTGFRDSQGAIEIDTWARTAEEIAECFYCAGFECRTHISLWLGEPEKPLFDRAGKSDLFTAASNVPAILVSHFRRASHATASRSEQ